MWWRPGLKWPRGLLAPLDRHFENGENDDERKTTTWKTHVAFLESFPQGAAASEQPVRRLR